MSTCNLQQRVEQFLYREARLLDDRQWDDWLACYHPQVEYWMPAWADDDRQTTDPHSEISLIYYANREGLEDRVYRIKPNAQPPAACRSRVRCILSATWSCYPPVRNRPR